MVRSRQEMNPSTVFLAALSQERAAGAESLTVVPFFPFMGEPALFWEEAGVGWGVSSPSYLWRTSHHSFLGDRKAATPTVTVYTRMWKAWVSPPTPTEGPWARFLLSCGPSVSFFI